jgi:uncharacterized FAD-dependent dehydrogenase
VEETYGDVSYNGHAKKGEQFRNDMTNFGILMEIKGIEDPFKWSRDVVQKCQDFIDKDSEWKDDGDKAGLYYSPSRKPSLTSEGQPIKCSVLSSHTIIGVQLNQIMGEYGNYIMNFIDNMNKVFEFGDDWGMYIPEVKYLSPEPLVNYHDLSLVNFNNVHFVGDALSARGITVAGAQGIYVAEKLIQHSHLVELTQVLETE